MLAIVDYGASNLRSVVNALIDLGERPEVVDRPEGLAAARRIVLPGVGAMPTAMKAMRACGMDEALSEAVIGRGVPFLGICLGLQLMATRGYEGQCTDALGWIDGEVVALPARPPSHRVPNIGWCAVDAEPDNPLFAGIRPATAFYFCHSYHLAANDGSSVFATTDFGEPVTAAIRRGSAMGVQFHPERSGHNGLKLIENFLDWDGGTGAD